MENLIPQVCAHFIEIINGIINKPTNIHFDCYIVISHVLPLFSFQLSARIENIGIIFIDRFLFFFLINLERIHRVSFGTIHDVISRGIRDKEQRHVCACSRIAISDIVRVGR